MEPCLEVINVQTPLCPFPRSVSRSLWLGCFLCFFWFFFFFFSRPVGVLYPHLFLMDLIYSTPASLSPLPNRFFFFNNTPTLFFKPIIYRDSPLRSRLTVTSYTAICHIWLRVAVDWPRATLPPGFLLTWFGPRMATGSRCFLCLPPNRRSVPFCLRGGPGPFPRASFLRDRFASPFLFCHPALPCHILVTQCSVHLLANPLIFFLYIFLNFSLSLWVPCALFFFVQFSQNCLLDSHIEDRFLHPILLSA